MRVNGGQMIEQGSKETREIATGSDIKQTIVTGHSVPGLEPRAVGGLRIP